MIAQSMRRKITNQTWEQVQTAFAAGVGLREIARNMGIPQGTVLARAKREGWTRQIQNAKALTKREDTPFAGSPVEAVAMSMQQRGERHVERMAGVSERALLITSRQWMVPKSLALSMKSKNSTRLRGGLLV
jgi:hypothetical protein